MIQHLHIENYTLIEQIAVDFSKGFSVITGETGAGKSMLIGALSFLMGARTDVNVLKDKTKKTIVEAVFDVKTYGLEPLFEQLDLDYQPQCVIRREINPQGKSRSFVNDTPVNASDLKKVGEALIDIHAQHSNILLQNKDFQLLVVDQYAILSKELAAYQEEYRRYKLLEKQYQHFLSQTNSQDESYLQFLFDELEAAKLVKDEQQTLEQEIETLFNTQEIKTKIAEILTFANQGPYNILELMAQCKQRLSAIARYTSQWKDLEQRFSSQQIEMQDIVEELERSADTMTEDPNRLLFLTERMDLIHHLMQKHKMSSIDELLELQNDLSNKLFLIANAMSKKQEQEQLLDTHKKTLEKLAQDLTNKRLESLPQLEKTLKDKLKTLNMPDVEVKIQRQALNDFTANGLDELTFLFSANKGSDLQVMSKIASGGELSRLMLVLKSMIIQKNVLPTIVFDEIDTGLSGEVSAKMAKVMREISDYCQVIAITHLPQIAAKAQQHYLIYKYTENEQTKTEIKLLTDEERVVEIAKMISNEQVSASSIEAAKILIKS